MVRGSRQSTVPSHKPTERALLLTPTSSSKSCVRPGPSILRALILHHRTLLFSRFFLHQHWLEKSEQAGYPVRLQAESGVIRSESTQAYCYEAAAISDFIRQQLLLSGRSFSFETVMSHPSTVDFIRNASSRGFKVYLYFVSTASVAINVDRVKQRVAKGGHDVPEPKIRAR